MQKASHIRRPPTWAAVKAPPSAVWLARDRLIAGPALIVPAAVGALIGGLAAKARDSGFPQERLKTIGDSLKPGTSAIVAVVEHKWVAEVQKAMQEAGADAVTEALSADIAAQLNRA
jgi:uncharacterized membrane protein